MLVLDREIGIAGAAIVGAALILGTAAGAEDAKSRSFQKQGAGVQMIEKPKLDRRQAPKGMRWVLMPDGSLGAVPEQSSPDAAALRNSGVSLECLCRKSKEDHCTFAVDAGGDVAKCGGDGTGCGEGDNCMWQGGPSPRFGGSGPRVAQ